MAGFQKLNLNTKSRSYDIIVGCGIYKNLKIFLRNLSFLPKDIVIVTNPLLLKTYGAALSINIKKCGLIPKFFTAPDSEKAKSIEYTVKLIESIASYAGQRKIAIAAFGGGVVGDLAGFIASIYKRGVPLIHIPTSLLAQLDSSIGGKTAIDLKIAKNLVGTFYQPHLVITDIEFLKSLDKKQLRSGLAEALKYAIIKDEKLFKFLENNFQQILHKDLSLLKHLIFECAKIKAAIVTKDERETKGLRTILNFGHTIGHALEAAGGYTKYSHGEAISIGMLCAAKISQKLKLLDEQTYKRIEGLIINIGLPQEISQLKENDIIKAYKLDKKFKGRTNRFVLIRGLADCGVYENIPENIINSSILELSVL